MSNLSSYRCVGKNGSFDLQKVLLLAGKTKCAICELAKIVFKKYAVRKNKIQKRWLLCRLSVVSFVPLLYVYFCRSFLFCRSLGLPVTFSRYKQFGIKSALSFGFAKSSKYKPIFQLSQMPKLLVACVSCSLFYFQNCLV
ncbi:hypothetical protein DTW91_03435 [Chryseobacterium sp. SC28]|nr:hypothetical protein DTW91_03435 [Chryseobacterium sp. SC28]